MFLDSFFSAAEKREVDSVSARVVAPRRTRDLLWRLVRVRRGNAGLRAAPTDGDATILVRRADRTSWPRDVALRNPALLLSAARYVVITLTAAILAGLPQRLGTAWRRDDSSRRQDHHQACHLGAVDGRR